MYETLIGREFHRRAYIRAAIALSIGLPKEELIKRGSFQNNVLKGLGLSRTTPLCNVINDHMKEIGFRLVTIKGYQYYKRIS